jgi:uridine kinase
MLVIGIAGGSGSGKTTVVKQIIRRLPRDAVSVLPQDAYYYDNGHLSAEEKVRINFDHPSSIEFDLLARHIDELKSGHTIGMPVYSYITCGRAPETTPVEPRKVLIVEGILVFTNEAIRKRCDIKIYVDAPADDRLIRIIHRDTRQRGRSFDQAIDHYVDFVKPMHEQFIEPTKQYADVIVPQGGQNDVAIDILASRILMNVRM